MGAVLSVHGSKPVFGARAPPYVTPPQSSGSGLPASPPCLRAPIPEGRTSVALAVRATRPGRQNPEQPEEWVLVEAQTTLAQVFSQRAP